MLSCHIQSEKAYHIAARFGLCFVFYDSEDWIGWYQVPPCAYIYVLRM